MKRLLKCLCFPSEKKSRSWKMSKPSSLVALTISYFWRQLSICTIIWYFSFSHRLDRKSPRSPGTWDWNLILFLPFFPSFDPLWMNMSQGNIAFKWVPSVHYKTAHELCSDWNTLQAVHFSLLITKGKMVPCAYSLPLYILHIHSTDTSEAA